MNIPAAVWWSEQSEAAGISLRSPEIPMMIRLIRPTHLVRTTYLVAENKVYFQQA